MDNSKKVQSDTEEKFLTVVFRITDKQQFKSTSDPLFSAFRGDSVIPGAEITGMSLEDEMTKVETLEAENCGGSLH